MQAVGKLPQVARILETVQGDHTYIDVLIRDDISGAEIGRPTLTTVIDVKSRCILGYYISFDPPSFGTFAQCFKRCLTPKINCIGSEEFPILQDIFGLPSVVVLDNAMEFTGISTQDAMNDIGVVLIFPPVKTPEAKPFVERLFGTLNSMGFRSLEGTTLNQAQKAKRGGDYKPTASLTLNALHEIIDHLIHAYHIAGHTGLRGLPPAHVWQQDAVQYGIPVLYDLDRVDSMLAVTELRVLARDGIQIHGLMYNHGPTTNQTLESFAVKNFDRRQKLKVKYNPHDLGCIWFYHPLDHEYLRLPCTDPGYASGLTLYQHKSIEAHLEAQGLRFSTTEQRLRARLSLENKIYQVTPGLVQKQRKSLARLAAKSGTKQKLDDLGLTSITGISLLPHEPLQSRKSDAGAPPKGARRGAAKAAKTRQVNTERRKAYGEREAQINNQDNNQSVDFTDSDWKGYDYE
ncbi:Mu transposase C-terminal domain-containing protein [Asticcacaulis benevestitus]|uniref:Integrase catalytic domain-containing protein n=2 Tax=Asticcacaulis TaxID=76890 RepID=V4P1H9_9CAUL|nr:Mu transposase C-terminal domain-containing protein [Asticcacaulis benevestitus]ESQ81991.1 hypothetical protein ABENE_21330 [Asticcacaulis benevestitus DSM 16100 = ATCC BAA-896]